MTALVSIDLRDGFTHLHSADPRDVEAIIEELVEDMISGVVLASIPISVEGIQCGAHALEVSTMVNTQSSNA